MAFIRQFTAGVSIQTSLLTPQLLHHFDFRVFPPHEGMHKALREASGSSPRHEKEDIQHMKYQHLNVISSDLFVFPGGYLSLAIIQFSFPCTAPCLTRLTRGW